MQVSGHFVLPIFVGLTNVNLSIGRVATPSAIGGHPVPFRTLRERFPRTRQAVRAAIPVAGWLDAVVAR